MTHTPNTEAFLVERIQEGDARAWEDLIARYEGRLLAFAESRTGQRAASEDIVQETFIGFLTSLPNYDRTRSLESYLFSICAYKLTDHLRREGRRPALQYPSGRDDHSSFDVRGPGRGASSIVRSQERRVLEEKALCDAIAEQIQRVRQGADWTKLRCLELLFVVGQSNKNIAQELGLSEQQVANYKSDFQLRLKAILRRLDLDEELFPDLHEQPE